MTTNQTAGDTAGLFGGLVIEDNNGTPIARFTRADNFQAGDTGAAVEQLNQFLVAAGFLPEEELGKQNGLGEIGTGTLNAIAAFRSANGLSGSRGSITADDLRKMRTIINDSGVTVNASTAAAGGRNLVTGDFGDTTVAKPGEAPKAEGGATVVPGIMGGGTLTKITRGPDDEPLWAMVYTVGGIQHVYTFDDFASVERTLGKDAVTSGKFGFQTIPMSTVNDGDTWILGSAEGFSGQKGTYATYFNEVMKEAALEAGISQPGKLGEFMSQPDIQRIIAEGAAGGWSDVRVKAELRGTDYYQNTLYPGIINFLNQGSLNPEAEYNQYMRGVSSSLDSLGYTRDSDGTFRTVVGEMLDKGITSDKFNDFAPTFIRAEQSPDFMAALNKWTQKDLGKDVSFEEWFDVLDGNAPADIAQVVEKATIQFQADRAGTLLDDATITRIANLTQISEAEARLAFSTAEQSLLTVGQANLARFGLSQEALVSAAFGIESVGTDPLTTDGTPFTAAEVQKRARKAATELGLQDDRKANFFVGFDSFNRPTRTGLRAGSPEAG